jgi:hypothetical protein
VQISISLFSGRFVHLMGGDNSYARLILIGMLGADVIMLLGATLGM